MSKKVLLTHQGRTMSIVDWARETGLPYNTLWARIVHGWTTESALTTPIAKGGRRASGRRAAKEYNRGESFRCMCQSCHALRAAAAEKAPVTPESDEHWRERMRKIGEGRARHATGFKWR
jgi:hypothetical protein